MKLALGSAQFGLNYGVSNHSGQVAIDEAKKIIDFAQSVGMNILDTAVIYGNSEQQLGLIGVDDWKVITKLPLIPDECNSIRKWIKTTICESLRKLNVSCLYGILLHKPEQLLGKNGDFIYQVLDEMKNLGLVRKIGISVYGTTELDAICDLYRIDIVQAPFNIIDNRLAGSGWLDKLKSQNTEVHTRSIFLQGLLLLEGNSRPTKFRHWNNIWRLWDEWLADTRLSPMQACVRHALSFNKIDNIIVGVNSVDQLKEIYDSINGSIPEVPEGLYCNDLKLINPANWSGL